MDSPPLTTDDQKNIILNILVDMMEGDHLAKWIDHVDFDIAALSDPKDFVDAWLGHYRLGQGTYDVDRALMDLRTWPPISRRIFELMDERKRLAT